MANPTRSCRIRPIRRIGPISLILLIALPALAEPRVGRVAGLFVRVHREVGVATQIRGDVLTVEATRTDHPCTLEIQHGAALGESTREGASAAAAALNGPLADAITPLGGAFKAHGVRIRFPGYSAPVDGGSAGVALTVAAASALLDTPVRDDVAVTGVLGERGQVFPVEAAELKLAAAVREGYDTVVLPLANARAVTAAAPLETFARVRVVGLDEPRDALFEAFGAAGPWAGEYADYSAMYHDGLERLVKGDAVGAEQRFAACVAYQPHDLAAQFWLDRCRHLPPGGQEPLVQAAALRRLHRYVEAEQAARNGPVAEAYRLDHFLTDLRRDQATWRRRGLLTEADAALEAGRLAEATERLETARATLADAPEGRDDLSRAGARLELAERRADAERAPSQAAWLAVVEAAVRSDAWEASAEAVVRARAAGPDRPELGYRAGQAALKLGRPDEARRLLLAGLLAWPGYLPTRELLLGADCDALPATPRLDSLLPLGNEPLRLHAVGQKPDTRLLLALDGHDLATGDSPLFYRISPTAERPGPHWLTVAAQDAAGNLSQAERPIVLRAAAPAEVPQGLVPEAPAYTVHLIAEGNWLVRPQDQVVVEPARWFAPALRLAGLPAEGLRVGLAPGDVAGDGARFEVTPMAWPAGVLDLELWGQHPRGVGLGPAHYRLIRNLTGLATITSPASGATVRAVTPVHLRVDPAIDPLLVRLLLDGVPGPPASAGQLRLDPAALTPGQHELAAAILTTDDRWVQTAPITVFG